MKTDEKSFKIVESGLSANQLSDIELTNVTGGQLANSDDCPMLENCGTFIQPKKKVSSNLI